MKTPVSPVDFKNPRYIPGVLKLIAMFPSRSSATIPPVAFCATNFFENMVGPGVGQAVYGGCFFLFPPRPIPDVWQDEQLDFATGVSERLIAGALFHSRERRVVVVSPNVPPPSWRRLAQRLRKQLVHIPLHRFSASTVERLRRFHVLNGREVRSYAARFIRDLR